MSNSDNQKKKNTGTPQPGHVNDLILGSLRPRTGRETSCWITGLVDESLTRELSDNAVTTEKPAGPVPSNTPPVRPSAVSFVDHLFDFFQQIEFDFNKTVAGTDCVVTIDRPTYSNEKIRVRFQQQETVKVFRGRISTRYWTLIIRAHNDIIEGWVIPIEQVFGFRPDDGQYAPFVTIEPTANRDQQPCWRVNGTEVAWDQARHLAKQIFAALIRIARGEDSNNERFRMSTGSERFANEVEPLPVHLTSSPLLGKPAAAPAAEAAVAPPVLQPQMPLQTPPKTKQTLRGTQTRKSSGGGEQSVDSIIDMLVTALNRDLQKLSDQGAEAFARQDMAAVEVLYRRAVRVKELQEQLIAGFGQWKKAVKEAMES